MTKNKRNARSGKIGERYKTTMKDNNNQLEVTNKFLDKPGKPGQPTKYNPARANLMVRALGAGLTHRQACLACGISRATLHTWLEKFPEFKTRVDAARDLARRDALEAIRSAGKDDWRALDRWLIRAFPQDYRPSERGTMHVSSQNTMILCDESTRAQIIELRRKLLGNSEGYRSNHAPGDPRITDAEFVEEEREE